MQNEKGVTLIELLGVLVILSVIITLIGSVLTSSIKTSNRATTDQRLQQEANYITEKIRNEYLSATNGVLEIYIEENQLKLDDEVISEGFIYCLDLEEGTCKKMEGQINRSKTDQVFQLKLSSKDQQRVHEIDTKFSKLK